MMERSCLLLLVSLSLLACGHPVRDLAAKVKEAGAEFVPDRADKATPGCAAQPTTRIELSANLQVEAAAGSEPNSGAPEAGASLTVSSIAYAADGLAVQLRILFVGEAQGHFEWHVLSASAELGAGSLTFDERGALESVDTVSELRLSSASGVVGAPIELSFGGSLEQGGDGLATTSTKAPSELRSYSQDGRARNVSCAE